MSHWFGTTTTLLVAPTSIYSVWAPRGCHATWLSRHYACATMPTPHLAHHATLLARHHVATASHRRHRAHNMPPHQRCHLSAAAAPLQLPGTCCSWATTLSTAPAPLLFIQYRHRGDEGDCLLLLRRYYHRLGTDAQGLTFMRHEAKKNEIFVVNSCELRAVKGHQKNDFVLNPINPPKQRAQQARKSKGAMVQELVFPANQKWALDLDVDQDTRRVCEAS